MSGLDILDVDRIDADAWGGWRLDPEIPMLIGPNRHDYAVDLNRCATAAGMLDWVVQVNNKGWSESAHIAGLLRALDDVLEPQRWICSFGQARDLPEEKLRELVDDAVDRGAPLYASTDE